MRQMLLALGCLALASARGGEESSRLEFRAIARHGITRASGASTAASGRSL